MVDISEKMRHISMSLIQDITNRVIKEFVRYLDTQKGLNLVPTRIPVQ